MVQAILEHQIIEVIMKCLFDDGSVKVWPYMVGDKIPGRMLAEWGFDVDPLGWYEIAEYKVNSADDIESETQPTSDEFIEIW